MNILIFGIGGIGGFVGGALARVCGSVYFYAHEKHVKAIRQKGLTLESVNLGTFTVKPKDIESDAEKLPKMDVVILSCKGNTLEAAARDMAPCLKPDTVVVPLLNGILISNRLAPLLPPCVVADGTIRVFSHLEEPGRVVQTAGDGAIVMGMKEGPNPPLLQDLAALLTKAGIPTTVTGDIRTASWMKYALMGTNSAIFCYYDEPAGKVRQEPGYRETLSEGVSEVIRAAASQGVNLPAGFKEDYLARFETFPPDTITSLYRDLASGKAAGDSETETILGEMVRIGQTENIPTPVFSRAYGQALSGKLGKR